MDIDEDYPIVTPKTNELKIFDGSYAKPPNFYVRLNNSPFRNSFNPTSNAPNIEQSSMEFSKPLVNSEISRSPIGKITSKPPPSLLNKLPDKLVQNAEPFKKLTSAFQDVSSLPTSLPKDPKSTKNSPQIFNPTPSLTQNSPNVRPPNLNTYKIPSKDPPNPPNESIKQIITSNSKKIDEVLTRTTQGIKPFIHPNKSNTNIPLNQSLLNIPKDNILIPITKFDCSTSQTKLKSTLDILMNYLDYDGIYEDNPNSLDKIKKFPFESEEKDKLIKLISEQNFCSVCGEKKNILKKLNCSHVHCKPCLRQKINNSWNNLLECQICNTPVEKYEESKIYKLCEVKKRDFEYLDRVNKFKQMNSTIECINCEKLKTNYFKNSCLHYCQECQSSLMRTNKVNCPKCNENWDLNELKAITFECMGCKGITNFISDFGKFLHGEKCLMCASCSYTSLANNKCKVCSKILKKVEKYELNDHLFTFCVGCKTEHFRGELAVSDCCQMNTCESCSSNPCRLCLKK